MSLSKLGQTLLVATALSWSVSAHAQRVDDGSDRFFAAKVAKKGEDSSNLVLQGSVTSTTFVFRELGDDAKGVVNPAVVANYSKHTRLFSDLRLQLDVKRLDGEGWSMRTDARVRIAPTCALDTIFINPAVEATTNCRLQSGTLGGNEYDVRELYAKRKSGKTELFVGRQFVPELAATKLDGLRFHYEISKRWKLIGFGGLNPSRISRSVVTDYPRALLLDGQAGSPILPIAAGMGGGYRMPDLYGTIGAAAIVPLATDRDTLATENPRVFLTDNGYWRPTNNLDIYHYAIFDLQGAAGFALTNLSLGANYRPKPGVTISGGLNRVDTETLNSIVQSQSLEVPLNATNVPYNYQDVARVASDSINVGASFALAKQRFEVSTRAYFRQRGEVLLPVPNDTQLTVEPIPATRHAELRISVLDRRSLAGMRLGASVSAILPIGTDGPNRSNAQILSFTGSRLFNDERGEFDINLSLTNSADVKDLGINCAVNDVLTCFGASDIMSVYANNLLYYRFGSSWLGIANVGFGVQRLTANNVAQPVNLLINGMVRVAYRF